MSRLRFARSLGRSVDGSLGRSVARSLGRSVARSLGRSVARSLDRSVARSLGRPIARSLDRSIGRSIDRSIARSLDPSIARSIARLLCRQVRVYVPVKLLNAWVTKIFSCPGYGLSSGCPVTFSRLGPGYYPLASTRWLVKDVANYPRWENALLLCRP